MIDESLKEQLIDFANEDAKLDNAELKIFSIDYPRESNHFENKYEYLFSWYKDGRNVNNNLIGDD